MLLNYHPANRACGTEIACFGKRLGALNFGVEEVSLQDRSQINQGAIQLFARCFDDVLLLNKLRNSRASVGDNTVITPCDLETL